MTINNMSHNFFKTPPLIILALLFLVGCSKTGAAKESYHFTQNGVDISVTAFVKHVDSLKNDFLIKDLFDKNSQTGCFLQAEHNSEIRFDFSKPVYLKKLTLYADTAKIKNILSSTHLAKHLSVMAYNDPSDVFPGGGTKYKLVDTKDPQVIGLDKDFLRVLKIKSLVIEIDNEAENWSHPVLWLSGIETDFSDISDFKPTMTLSSIQEKFARENKTWFFNQKEKMSENSKNEILMNIIYYAKKGDKGAEKMLNNYSPQQADEGEWASFLQDWYESLKKGTK